MFSIISTDLNKIVGFKEKNVYIFGGFQTKNFKKIDGKIN